MAGITLDKGKRIYKAGQPMTALHLIVKGKVTAEYPGGSYQLGKGDVIGICELCSEVHFLGYSTLEETSILTYPVSSLDALDDLLQKHPDVARLFLLSLFHQINILLEQSYLSEMNCTGLHQNLTNDYKKYNALCNRYHIQPRVLENLEETAAFLGEDSPDTWLNTYYLGLQHFYSSGDGVKSLMLEPGVSLGFIRKGSLDFRKTYTVLDEHLHYRTMVAGYYFNSTGEDLFDFFSSLYYKLGQNNEDAESLYADLNRMADQFENDPALDKALLSSRIKSFRDNLARVAPPTDGNADKDAGLHATIMQELSGSLNSILEYADLKGEDAVSFRQNINAYKTMEDKSSMDDSAIRLRKKLTEEFYKLYALVFERTTSIPYIPIPVKMFLYFGYVDEDLAGTSNCLKLYQLACGMEDQSDLGVYTLYHWLQAIYDGKKEPSRNEFDEDYNDFLHKQKVGGNLSSSELLALESDPMNKVDYELKNMFPQVNKMTCGRITTFCPIFSSDNVIKDLNSAFVTTAQISKAFETIKSIDYSAFYRESLDYENMDAMGKETIHLEFLPDIILMPNVGLRGVMWQEIEGKKRNTPGRMFFSVFHMEDINTSLIRLTGEFRWEMCKRIQGSRWNDISERSLTSEYFDYIQFYRKNHDLSSEAKEKIRTSLQRAKNSFKEMFVRDYIIWVLFEGNGSPRLNRVARKILFSYCPFPAALASGMGQNPLYAELLSRQKILNAQRVHHLEVLKQKLNNSGISIPATLEAEINFTLGKS